MGIRRGTVTRWVEIPCPLCGGRESDPAYAREHETGSALGRIRKIEVLCRTCGFMFTNPRPSPEDMRRYYSEASGASGDVFHSLQPGSRLERLTAERVRFANRLLEGRASTASGAILDIGCSTGDLLVGLAREGWRRSGLEPSPRAAEKACARGLDVAVGEIERAAIPAGAFDLVTCISVLEHVSDLEAALAKIAIALRPGGLAIVEVPDSTRPEAQIAEFYSLEHLSHFTRGTLTRALGLAGLAPVAFDDAVGIPNLRVAVGRKGEVDASSSADVIDDRAELQAALARYVRERRALEQGLIERLSTRTMSWRASGARVAVYGAGMHTRFLMDLFDLAPSVACVLDSDPGKAGSAFLEWPVHAPDEIPRLELDAILISSNAFEAEIYAAIAPTAAQRGIEVVRCYG
ncbi:MAG: class I SAM-dependent methyltransferase [Deltaproteobacteria bacterium]|nr:class I SAM-dependent methyltransferase [Deltaproteobacteria bacterium]